MSHFLARIIIYLSKKSSYEVRQVLELFCKFTTTVYRKPTFSGVYSNCESFLPSVYKFGMVYTFSL